MVSDPHGDTPAQYLEAGYRAEQSGERDRAAQYYHYVAEAFPETPEGEAARGGLMRLGTGDSAINAVAAQHAATRSQQQSPAPRSNEVPHAHPAQSVPQGSAGQRLANNGSALGQHGPPQRIGQAQRPPDTGAQAAAAHPGQGQRIVLGDLARLKLAPTSPPAQQPPQGGETHVAHTDAGHGDPMRLPDVVARRARELAEADAYTPRPKYRGGRMMARMFVWLGWLIVAGGLASIVVGLLAMPAALAQTGAGFVIVLLAAGVVIVGGLLVVRVGQLALAVFDGSNALREITAFMRARQDL